LAVYDIHICSVLETASITVTNNIYAKQACRYSAKI